MATTTATLPNILIRNYDRVGYIAPHERHMTPFYSECESFPKGTKPIGSAVYWGIRTKDSHATGAAAESAVFPTFSAPGMEQASASAIQVAAAVRWSELMLAVGQAGGTITAEDIIDDQVKMTTRNLMTRLNSLSLGHGTGRLAVVEASTVTATTAVMRLPEGTRQLRAGMLVDEYDLDTSGSATNSGMTIASIDHSTRTVTFSAAVTLTAGYGIYKSLTATVSTYGVAPNGLRNILDNGTLTSTIFGITRATVPQVNATVMGVSSGTQDYSEKLIRKGLNRVADEGDGEIDEAWMSPGVLAEHYNHTTPDRIYMVASGDNVPRYRIGANQQDVGFQFDGRFIPYRVDRDLPTREIAFISKRLFRKYELRKANWVGDGIGPEGQVAPFLLQAPSTTTYALDKIAGMLWMGNLGHLQPKLNLRITNIKDEEAGDT